MTLFPFACQPQRRRDLPCCSPLGCCASILAPATAWRGPQFNSSFISSDCGDMAISCHIHVHGLLLSSRERGSRNEGPSGRGRYCISIPLSAQIATAQPAAAARSTGMAPPILCRTLMCHGATIRAAHHRRSPPLQGTCRVGYCTRVSVSLHNAQCSGKLPNRVVRGILGVGKVGASTARVHACNGVKSPELRRA